MKLDNETSPTTSTPPVSALASTGATGIVTAMRILIAEDEAKVATHIRHGLTEAGYAVDVAADRELQLDAGRAERTGRGDLVDAGAQTT